MPRVPLLLLALFVIAVPVATGLYVFFVLKSTFLDAVDPAATETVSFMIHPGSTFQQISRQLVDERFVKRMIVPRVIVKIRGVDTRNIRAGEYALSRSMPPGAIISKIISGDIVRRRITVTEGMNIRDVAKGIAAAGLMNEQEFLKILYDPLLLKKWGIAGNSFEGYLFPETYFFSLPVKGEDIIAAMIKEGEKFWPESYTVQAESLSLTRHQVLTLASIIEKESGNPEEQPLVSSVLHNRLDRGMKLQADPTVIYGIDGFNGNLTKADLEKPSLYNTYVIDGLPPGPIANPGRTAVKAALYPAQTNFLYFVSDGTGKHTFSGGLTDHNKAVDQLIEMAKQGAAVPPAAPETLTPPPKTPVITVKPKK